MAKLASGRVTAKSSQLLDEFNSSIMFDKNLYKEDIKGSKAHALMLSKQDILSKDELREILDGLSKIEHEIENGAFIFDIADEDIHMAIEKRLTQLIGDAGKKLHTARSRNDQVALDFRLYVLKSCNLFQSLLLELIKTILDISKEHIDTLLPGYTHLQHAQPINFGYHLLAYVAMFQRDIQRFKSTYERNNISPIGCAALAGTPHNIDRKFTASELGFDEVSINCLDTVSDRDFALEILFNISTLMMHISRLSEELILWSSSEFNFVTLSDEYSTSSSIMPQKKNPDVPELLRGKSGRVYGNLISLLTVLKGLPLAYNKDMQEDKEGVFDSVKTADISIRILTKALATMSVNISNMKSACEVGHLSATDLADYLVNKCKIPFRDAYKITGLVVLLAEDLGVDLTHLTLKQLQSVDKRIGEDVFEFINLRNSMNARDSEGGTSTKSTQMQIDYFKKWVENYEI